jgi:hypothetical protein
MDYVSQLLGFPVPVKDQRLPVVAFLDAPALEAAAVSLGGHVVPLAAAMVGGNEQTACPTDDRGVA